MDGMADGGSVEVPRRVCNFRLPIFPKPQIWLIKTEYFAAYLVIPFEHKNVSFCYFIPSPDLPLGKARSIRI